MEKEIFEVADKTWMISDYRLDNYYLAEGEKLAMLIDTGAGIGTIIDDIRKKTAKPLIVALTHGHLDHCGGSYAFEKVYMNPIDEELAKRDYNNEFRKYYIESRVPSRFPGEGNVELLKEKLPKEILPFSYVPLHDGQIFELGNRSIEVITSPGHTEGSVCFLDKTNRILFSGDTVNDSTIMFEDDQDTGDKVEKYRKSLQKLWNRSKEYDYIMVGHDAPKRKKDMINDYIELIDQLIASGYNGTYETQGIRKGWVYRYKNIELWYRCES